MPTNFYFDIGTTPEQNLYEDLVIEQLKIFGQDVYYLPRTLVAEDTVLGEDALSKSISLAIKSLASYNLSTVCIHLSISAQFKSLIFQP